MRHNLRMTPEIPAAQDNRRRMAGSMFIGFAAIAVFAGVAIATASIVRNPNVEGVLGGVFGGMLLALLVAVSGAWIAMRLAFPRAPPDTGGPAEIEASLQDVSSELEASRLETIRRINARAAWRAPLCLAGGVLVWALGDLEDFARPIVLCVGRKLMFAMPKRVGRDLFAPPSFRKPAACAETLMQLHRDITAVIAAADAVIDLDYRFEVMARQ